ncbi:TIGR04372 family glycosyltransferase [Chloroflexota bacterium]
MYKRIFPIIESPLLFEILKFNILKKSIFYESLPAHGEGEPYYFDDTKPLLHFTESEEEKGRMLLNKMGIDSDSWYICFYCRDSAYLSSERDKRYGWRVNYNPFDLSYQDHRNNDIKTYLESAEYITSLGGFAVRMGANVDEKLPDLNNPRIIDYSWYHRTEFGDIYLPAKCKFFLGGTSGLWAIPAIFDVPIACPNFIRYNIINFRQGSWFIPKKIWSAGEKRYLTFREILQSEVADFYRDEHYAKAGLEVVDNTPEEILDLAREMNERLDGTFETTEEDEELQNRFLSLYPEYLYSYGTPARIGTVFLRKNEELLE